MKDVAALCGYMSSDLVARHMSFDYGSTNPIMVAYYNAFKYLVLPTGKVTTQSEDDKLVDIVQTHNMWRPHYYGTTTLDYKTLYIVINNDEMDNYVKNNYIEYNQVGDMENNLTCVHQHIYLFERAQTVSDDVFAVVSSKWEALQVRFPTTRDYIYLG